jgi:hypothetical protein
VTSFHVLVVVGVDLVFAMVPIIALATLCFRMTSLVGARFPSAPVRAPMEEVAKLWVTWVHALALATGLVSLAPFLFAKPTVTCMEPVTGELVLAMLDGKGFIVICPSVELAVAKGLALHLIVALAMQDGEVHNVNITTEFLHSVRMPLVMDVTMTVGRVDVLFELAIVLHFLSTLFVSALQLQLRLVAAALSGLTTCLTGVPVQSQNARKAATTAHALLRIYAFAMMVGQDRHVPFPSAPQHAHRTVHALVLTNALVALDGREPLALWLHAHQAVYTVPVRQLSGVTATQDGKDPTVTKLKLA